MPIVQKDQVINKLIKNMNFLDKEGWNITLLLEMHIK